MQNFNHIRTKFRFLNAFEFIKYIAECDNGRLFKIAHKIDDEKDKSMYSENYAEMIYRGSNMGMFIVQTINGKLHNIISGWSRLDHLVNMIAPQYRLEEYQKDDNVKYCDIPFFNVKTEEFDDWAKSWSGEKEWIPVTTIADTLSLVDLLDEIRDNPNKFSWKEDKPKWNLSDEDKKLYADRLKYFNKTLLSMDVVVLEVDSADSTPELFEKMKQYMMTGTWDFEDPAKWYDAEGNYIEHEQED